MDAVGRPGKPQPAEERLVDSRRWGPLEPGTRPRGTPPMRIRCHILNRLWTRPGSSTTSRGQDPRVDTGLDGSRRHPRRGFRLAVEGTFGYLDGPGMGFLPVSSRLPARRSASQWVPCIQFTPPMASSSRAPFGIARDSNQDLPA